LFFKRIKVFVSFWSAFDWEQFNSQKYIYSFFWTKIQILFDLFSFLISLSCITLCDTLYPFFGSKFFFEYSLLFCSTQSLSFGYLFRIEISLVQFLLTLFTCFKYLKKRRKNNICIHLHLLLIFCSNHECQQKVWIAKYYTLIQSCSKY